MLRCTLRQLEIFVTVVEQGGFAAASARLHMVQPAVSIAVRKLEDSAGVRLLERSSQGVFPTREGTVLLTHAQGVLNQMKSLGVQLADMQGLTLGHISMGAPPIMGALMVPPLIDGFLARHPGIQIRFVEDSSSAVAARVRTGELDIGFIPASVSDEGLETVLVDRPAIICAVAQTSPLASLAEITWEEILDQPLLVLPPGYNQRTSLDEVVLRLGRPARIRVESENWLSLLQLARRNCGVCLLFQGADRLLDGLVGIPIQGGPATSLLMCRQKQGARSVAADAFFNQTRDVQAPIVGQGG